MGMMAVGCSNARADSELKSEKMVWSAFVTRGIDVGLRMLFSCFVVWVIRGVILGSALRRKRTRLENRVLGWEELSTMPFGLDAELLQFDFVAVFAVNTC